MDEENFNELAERLEQIERDVRERLTPEVRALNLAWIKMAVALQPEITLGCYPRGER